MKSVLTRASLAKARWHLSATAELERAAQASSSCNPKSAITSAGIRNGMKARNWVRTGQVRNGQSRVSLWVSPDVAGRAGFKSMKDADFAAMYAAEQAADTARVTAALLGN